MPGRSVMVSASYVVDCGFDARSGQYNVMVSVSNLVDRGFDAWSGQSKDYTLDKCWFIRKTIICSPCLATLQYHPPLVARGSIHMKTFFSCNWSGWFMVFNATLNNISVIQNVSWRSVLSLEETGENHWPVASHWKNVSHIVVSNTLHHQQDSNSQR